MRERIEARGGNSLQRGVGSWKRNAELNHQESQAGRQAGNRSIALARTHGPVPRYTLRRGILHLLWIARQYRMPRMRRFASRACAYQVGLSVTLEAYSSAVRTFA